ncbi:pyridoxamine 5'-phosphate oxidase family protein [Saccharopolyspora shandongensis]|uniref:pyridoxamine 5'-phosphate oxidase family protein n=1 Tax=Saccharopolyspora shandongensis TaxID=418495 RepID=UPI0033C16508
MTRRITHEGERAVQERVGGRGSPDFGPKIPDGFGEFLQNQRMLIIGAPDENREVWATILTGDTGFADPLDETTIALDALPVPGSPLSGAFDLERQCGTLAIDPRVRRRIRVNGRARQDGDRLILRTEQVFRNCPKYIQLRELRVDSDPAGRGEISTVSSAELSAYQQEWINSSDTFFIASYSEEHGADANHRGGQPGFVTVSGGRRLSWPDYVGNSFYMTLGNLELDPACGLLFLDWENGHALHLTGHARVDWNRGSAPGAKRVIHFDVNRVVQVDNATALRWGLVEYSSFNPC